MRNLRTFALFLALAGSLTLSARADNLAPNTWTLFYFQNAGDLVSSNPDSATTESTNFFANGPTTINVTDGWLAGDEFTVYDNGVLLGTTSGVNPGPGTCDDPATCFVDPIYSHGSWKVGAGQNDITLYATVVPVEVASGAWIESFSTVPEPSTITFLGSGLLCLAGVLRRRRAR